MRSGKNVLPFRGPGAPSSTKEAIFIFQQHSSESQGRLFKRLKLQSHREVQALCTVYTATNSVLFYNLRTTDLHQDHCLLEYDTV